MISWYLDLLISQYLHICFTPLPQASLERGLSQEEDREDGDRRRERREERDDGRGGHRGHYSSHGGPEGSLASLLTKPDVLAAVTMIGQLSQGGGFGQVTDNS